MTAPLPRRRRALARPLAVLAIPAALLAGASPAVAGELNVYSGSLPDGTAVTVGPWSGLTENAPGGAGAFGVTMRNVPQGWSHAATLGPPPNLSLSSATLVRTVDLPQGGNHSQPQAQTTWENRGWPYTGVSPQGGYTGDTTSGAVTATNPSSLWLRLSCVNFNGVAGTCGAAAIWVDRAHLVLRDEDTPTTTGQMSGELLGGGWLTGATASVSVTAADSGSGVYRAFIRAGSQTFYASVDPAHPRCRDARPTSGTPYDFVPSALTLVPCPTASATYTPTFDLTALGDGVHLVSMGIEDASGNERTVLTNRTLRVNAPGGALADPGTPCRDGTNDEAGVCRAATNGGGGGGGGVGGAGTVTPTPSVTTGVPSLPPPSPSPAVSSGPHVDERRANGDGASASATLTLRVDGESRDRVSVPYGRTVVVTGRVAARGGAPIGGAAIDVSAVRRGTTAREAPVISAPDGSFRFAVAPGPSRTLRFAYRAFADDGDYADTADLEIGVRTGARLRVAPRTLRNGEAVTFRGRVAGAPDRSRKVVEMQVSQDGRWLTFGTTRLHRGRFRYRYRFTRTSRTTRYVFRTVVRSDGSWPYETGASNRIAVEVRG